jgi:hypothetical protein
MTAVRVGVGLIPTLARTVFSVRARPGQEWCLPRSIADEKMTCIGVW